MTDKYDGPRLCKYDEYAPCENPTECWGDLVNGHCWWDNDFRPEPPEREWKLTKMAPMKPDAGPIAFIDVDRNRGHDTAERVPEHMRVPTGGNGLAYCAINRGSCPSVTDCEATGHCIWRHAADTFDPVSVKWCMQNMENVWTTSSDVSMGPLWSEEEIKAMRDEPHSPREAAYDEAIVKAINETEHTLEYGGVKMTAGITDGSPDHQRLRSNTGIPFDDQQRKDTPLFDFLVTYFPRTLVELSRFSREANDKHNPGERMHWAKGKSQDHLNCVARHMFEAGTRDAFGYWHDIALAWRALANAETRLEAEALGVTYEELQERYREGKDGR